MKRSKLGTLVLTSVFMLAAAGCDSRIGPRADSPALKGQTTQEQIFPGGPVQTSTHIAGSALKSGGYYTASGKVTIDGDVPDNVTLKITDGKLVVNGRLGNGDNIEVDQPLVTHDERHSCVNYNFGPSLFHPLTLSPHLGYRSNGCAKEIVDGLRYNDPEPAINVTGGYGQNIKIDTPGAVVLHGRMQPNPGQFRPY